MSEKQAKPAMLMALQSTRSPVSDLSSNKMYNVGESARGGPTRRGVRAPMLERRALSGHARRAAHALHRHALSFSHACCACVCRAAGATDGTTAKRERSGSSSRDSNEPVLVRACRRALRCCACVRKREPRARVCDEGGVSRVGVDTAVQLRCSRQAMRRRATR